MRLVVGRVVAVLGYFPNLLIFFIAGFPWQDSDWLNDVNQIYLRLWNEGW